MKELELTMRLKNNRIKQRRLELGLSPAQAAEKAGLTYRIWLEIDGEQARFIAAMAAEPLIIGAEQENRILANQRTEMLNQILSDGFSEGERQVLGLRYVDDFSLTETASKMRRSTERVRQIEAKALRKLRHPSKAKLIEGLRGEA